MKKGIVRKIQDVFKSLDGFGVRMHFRMGETETHKSSLGGFFFISYVIFALTYATSHFVDFVTRNNMIMIYFQRNKHFIVNFEKQKFAYAMGLEFYNGTSALEAFNDSIELEMEYVEREGAWGSGFAAHQIPVGFCEPEDYFWHENEFDPALFDQRGYANNLCAKRAELNGTLSNFTGLFSQDVYSFVAVTLKIKEDYMDKIETLKRRVNQAPLRVSLYYKDSSIDFENVEKPVINYLNTHLQYLDVDTYKKIDMDFSLLSFGDDKNILNTKYTFEENVMLATTREYFYKFEKREIVESEMQRRNLLTYYLQSSPHQVFARRKFQKLTELIADMAGILTQLVLVLLFIFNYANRLGAYQKIMNRAMKFKGKKHFDIVYLKKAVNSVIKNTDKISKENRQARMKSDNDMMNSPISRATRRDEEIINSERKNFVNIQTMKNSIFSEGEIKNTTKPLPFNFNQHTPLRMSTWEFICSKLICCKKKWKAGEALIAKGEEKVCSYLDVMTYIKKIQEIDTLKYLLFKKDQLVLFNFLSSPTLSIANTKSELYKEYEQEIEFNMKFGKEQIDHLKKSYVNAINQEELNEIDSRLLDLFHTEINNLKKS